MHDSSDSLPDYGSNFVPATAACESITARALPVGGRPRRAKTCVVSCDEPTSRPMKTSSLNDCVSTCRPGRDIVLSGVRLRDDRHQTRSSPHVFRRSSTVSAHAESNADTTQWHLPSRYIRVFSSSPAAWKCPCDAPSFGCLMFRRLSSSEPGSNVRAGGTAS